MTTRTEIISQIDSELDRLERARDFLTAALAQSRKVPRAALVIASPRQVKSKPLGRKRKQPVAAAAPATQPSTQRGAAGATIAPPQPAKEEPQIQRVPPKRRVERRHSQAERNGKSGAALSGTVPTGPVAVSADEARKVQERAVQTPAPSIAVEPRPEIGSERSLASLIQAFERRAGMNGLETP